MIINRAERDQQISDYHKEIRKMLELENERGPLFEREEKIGNFSLVLRR